MTMKMLRLLTWLTIWAVALACSSQSSAADEPPPGKTATVEKDERIERYRAHQFTKWLKQAEDALDEGSVTMASMSYKTALKHRPSVLPDAERVQRFERRLAEAQKLIAVTLKSDGRTWVWIDHPLNPVRASKFHSTTVMIPAGTYFANGRRSRYHDEHVPFEVQPGSNPIVVTVICKTPKP